MRAEHRLRTLIVDDEPLAIQRLQILSVQIQSIEIIGTASDGESALRLIAALSPHLVLLDIAMPGLSGMEIARALEGRADRPAIIFVTAFSEFALAAFDVAAMGYLLKPVAPDQLAKAIARIAAIQPAATAAPSDVAPSKVNAKRADFVNEFWVPQRSEMIRIAAADIDRIEAEGDYMRLHLGARSFLLHQTITALEQQLDPALFIRLHRSTIVRRSRIIKLRHDGLGIWYAVLGDGHTVRIGRSFLAKARALMGRES